MTLKYLRQYKWADMRQIRDNDRAEQKIGTGSLEGRHCVITGATSGVGWEAAQVLAAHGATLTLINRNAEKSGQVRDTLRQRFGSDCRVLLADFSKPAEVHLAAQCLLNSPEPVDVLINNAGLFSTRRILAEEGLELTFCVNHLASFILTLTLLPKMRDTPGARILQVNSQGHRFNGLQTDDLDWKKRRYTGMRGYGAAKSAQLLCTWEFADLLAGSGVTCNAMHPGAVKSAIGENNGVVYRWYKKHLVDKSLKDPAIAGTAIHYLVTAPELATVSGSYFNLTMPERPAPHARDRELGMIVWQRSQALFESTKPGVEADKGMRSGETSRRQERTEA